MQGKRNWKKEMKLQIKEASRMRVIGGKLKSLAIKLLEADTEFNLVYSSGAGIYSDIRFKGEVSSESKKIVLQNTNTRTYMSINKNKRLK